MACPAPDMDVLCRDGFCILPHAVGEADLNRFEAAISLIGASECAKFGLDPGREEPLARAMAQDPDYRVFLFAKVKQLWCLSAMTRTLLDGLEDHGYLERAGIRMPGVHQTLKGDLPGDHRFDLPWHQDHVLTRSHRSCRLWVALRDVDGIRGGMEIAVGSHASRFDYRTGRDGYRHIPDEAVAGSFETRTLELPAGHAVLFDPLVVHRTVPNRGDRIRFSLIVHVDDLTALYGPDEITERAHGAKL